MSFLAPWFLLGTLAVALPVIFHLIRRTTRERTVFSSLMFLRPTPPRLTQRSRIEHWLLLLLRATVIGLLAFGFARPFLRQALRPDAAGAPPRRMLVLVDVSASLQRSSLWAQARERIDTILGRTSSADQVALALFDRRLTPLMTWEEWNGTAVGDRVSVARQKLAPVRPGWAATRLDEALTQAAEWLANTGSGAGKGQIIVVSDFQEGSRLASLQAYAWPKGVEVVLEPLRSPGTSNAGLQWLPEWNEAQPGAPGGVRLRVNNSADSRQEQFQVGWVQGGASAFIGPPVAVYVPPGQARVVALPAPPTNAAPDRIGLRGDDEPFDNTVFVLPREQAQVRVLYVGTEPATDSRQPLSFLRRAFGETPDRAVQVMAVPDPARLTPADWSASALTVVTLPIAEAWAGPLREAVGQGRTVLFAPRDAAAAGTLGRLVGPKTPSVEDYRPANYALLGALEFEHPLFAPFADARFSDFTKIHFWRYRRWNEGELSGARVLARFDSGDPAVFEWAEGAGRIVGFASGWHPEDSQLALSSKFVPLMYSMLELGGMGPNRTRQYAVGDPVTLEVASGRVERPDGQTAALGAGETNFTGTTLPGVYRWTGPNRERRWVVNLEAAESRTSPLPLDELERLGVPVPRVASDAAAEARHQITLQNTELERRQKLWRWLILVALGALLAETWLAGRAARALALGERTA